jgi:putative redox protein
MDNNVQAEVRLINDKIKFTCKAKGNPEIITDYIPPLGNHEGYMPLEVFLVSLGACTSGTVLPLLRAMRKTVGGFAMKIEGVRREEHPTSFERIIMDMEFQSDDLEPGDVEKALKLAEDKYCPVWAMIKNNVTVETTYRIIKN